MGRLLPSIFFLSLWFHTSILARAFSYTYTEKYVQVPVDHFSFTDNRTFELRYCVNDLVWEPNNGPVFFYTGNESPVETFLQNSGFIWELAITFRALIVFAEHRFYGKSMPFGNLSFSDPKYYSYLTTQQVLADFVDVIYHLREEKKRNLPTNGTYEIPNPVIAFGGSYGGMLAAWMRMKYPELIEGSLASSAPIWSFVDMVKCDAFRNKLTSIYASTFKLCPINIRKFWDELNVIGETESGRLWLSSVWKLCSPLQTVEDVQTFRCMLENFFVDAATGNYPYPAGLTNPLPANPVKEMCTYINRPNLSGNLLIEAMAKVASVYFNYTGKQECLCWNGNALDDAWTIQTCLEMPMPSCSNGNTDMFLPNNWTFEEWDNQCYTTYKVHPPKENIQKLYGGLNIDAASNIIFSNGEIDPWIVGGVTNDKLFPAIKVIVLEQAAHHLDLREANVNDPPSVKRAREMYETTFKKWIKEYYKKRKMTQSEYKKRMGEPLGFFESLFSWWP